MSELVREARDWHVGFVQGSTAGFLAGLSVWALVEILTP